MATSVSLFQSASALRAASMHRPQLPPSLRRLQRTPKQAVASQQQQQQQQQQNSQSRALSTTRPSPYRQPPVPDSDLPIPSPTAAAPQIPPYPPGPHRVFKQSNFGLYGTQRIRFGNTVSQKHENKSRRRWWPNVQRKRLWSASLGVFVQTRVTTRVLRTIDKVGGLDEYLLGGKAARVRELGPWGWRLRWRIMQTPAVQERFAREREALGLAPLTAAAADGLVGQVPIEILAEQGIESTEALLEETERMLKNEEEFELTFEGEELRTEKDPKAGR